MEVTGPLRPILTAERTALNFLGHLSGIATLTARFVAAAHAGNPAVQVLDTRKTLPGLRLLEKAAVRAGGGTNHRMGLSDAVLVKDNHLAGITITDAVARARALWPGRMVEIECDTLDQVAEAARAGADAVLLDNMDPAAVVEAVAAGPPRRAGPILTEVSGGVSLDTIGAYAAAGPDRISVGALTHSATGARPRARPRLDDGRVVTNSNERREELNVLLVIDVGNTETVIGLYARADTDTVPVIEDGVGVGIGTEHDPTAPRGLTHHWRLSTVPTRTPDEHAVLLTQLLDLEGLDIASVGDRHRRQLVGAARHHRAPPDGDALVLRRPLCRARARARRAACRSSTTTPRRSGPTALRTPSGPTTSTAAPASSSTWARRPRWRRSAPRASTSVGPSPRAWPSASRRSTSRPPPYAGSSWSSRAT